MTDIGRPAPATRGWVREITGYQWAVLFVAWAGWSLDITDFTLYGLVLRQSLTELLGGNLALPHLLQVGGLITTKDLKQFNAILEAAGNPLKGVDAVEIRARALAALPTSKKP